MARRSAPGLHGTSAAAPRRQVSLFLERAGQRERCGSYAAVRHLAPKVSQRHARFESRFSSPHLNPEPFPRHTSAAMTELDRLFLTLRLALAILGLSLVSPVAAHAMGEVAALDTMVQLSANDTQPNGTWSETAGAMSWLLDVSLHEVPDEPSGRRRAWYRACQRRGGRDSLPFAAIVPEPGSIPTLAPLYRTEQLQVDAAWRHPESRVGRVGGSRAPPTQHLH